MQRTSAIAVVVAWALTSVAPALAAAEEAENVLQVLIVDVAPEKLDAYLSRVERLGAIQERLGTVGRFRMWRAVEGSAATGNVIVSIEYDDLNAFAENYARLEADAEWQAVMEELPAIRKLLSSGLYAEITP